TCDNENQTFGQEQLRPFRPVQNVQPDVKEDNKGHHLDRTVQELNQQVIELGLGSGGKVPEPNAGHVVDELGSIKCQQDIDERGDVLPKQLAQHGARLQRPDPIQAKGQIVAIQLLDLSEQPGDLVGRSGGRQVCSRLSVRP